MTPKEYPFGPAVGEHILPFVARPLPSATSDVRVPLVGLPLPTTLVYADAAGCSKPLAAGLSLLGRSSAIVHTPLDVIRGLQDNAIQVRGDLDLPVLAGEGFTTAGKTRPGQHGVGQLGQSIVETFVGDLAHGFGVLDALDS